MKRTKKQPLSAQVKRKVQNNKPKASKQYDGDTSNVISTGSTLLDLAISGGRVRGGGIPTGILVEVAGPAGSGKTVLLSEIAGAVQRRGGEAIFQDPEGRLNKQFAAMFGVTLTDKNYSMPDTVNQMFQSIRAWEPTNPKAINGVFTDSLAALSTELEMDNKEGDKMGMKRAKDFSEQLRKTCRELVQKNQVMVASNQLRENAGATYGPKYRTPGGEAIGFYCSLRLMASTTTKIKQKETIKGKEVERIIGVTATFTIAKSSVWKPYREAPLTILFDYGIDDIRENLKFVKKYTGATVYSLGGEALDKSLEKAIQIIEEEELEKQLKEETIDLWESIEKRFDSTRKTKKRTL